MTVKQRARGINVWQRGFAPYVGTSRAAFMPYWPLGYPHPRVTLDYVRTLIDAGADMLGLGLPAPDPLSDGPAVRTATQHALTQGMTVAQVLTLLRQLREEGERIPIVLITYVTPLLAHGLDAFLQEAAAAGVDGLIVADIPPEEGDTLERLAQTHDLALIYPLAPSAGKERIRYIIDHCTGFTCLVSAPGSTDEWDGMPPDFAGLIHRVHEHTSLPLVVGFGFARSHQVRAAAQKADGVIVGNALVRAAENGGRHAMAALARSLARAAHDEP